MSLGDYTALRVPELLDAAADLIAERGLACGVPVAPTGEVDIVGALLLASGMSPRSVASGIDPEVHLGEIPLVRLHATLRVLSDSLDDDLMVFGDTSDAEAVIAHLHNLSERLVRAVPSA